MDDILRLYSSDINDFCDVIEDAFNWGDTHDDDYIKYQKRLDDPNFFTLGYFINYEMAGLIHVIIDNDNLYIDLLGVKKAYQGRSIGTKIVNHLFNRLKFFDGNNITLDCTIDSKSFYEKFGFKTINTHYERIGEERSTKTVDIYTMQRKINKKTYVNRRDEINE